MKRKNQTSTVKLLLQKRYIVNLSLQQALLVNGGNTVVVATPKPPPPPGPQNPPAGEPKTRQSLAPGNVCGTIATPK